MASLIHLDTHVVVWLYLPRLDLLTEHGRELLETFDLEISPAVLLELEYLHEIGRLRVRGGEVVHSLHAQIGLTLSGTPFGRIVHAAVDQAWTRDPFDRLICGQAAASGAQLLTRDESIHIGFPDAVW